jgi:hypothetical protein
MGKSLHDDVLDAALDEIATANILTVCNAEPTDRTEATATYKLADVVVTAGDGNGDFTVANGDSSGRKVTVAEQAAIDVDTTGTATHIALCDGSDLLAVTTCTSQGLTQGNTTTVPAWKITFSDPA